MPDIRPEDTMRSLALGLSLLVACPLAAQDTPQSVSVTIAGTRAHAGDLTQAALVGQGFAIDRADESVVVSAPRNNRHGTHLVVRASLLPVGADSVRVVLSAVATASMALAIGIFRPAPTMTTVSTKTKPEYRILQAIREAIAQSAAPGHS